MGSETDGMQITTGTDGGDGNKEEPLPKVKMKG